MYTDVVDLRDFYATRLGQVARRMIRRRIRLLWPDLGGMRVLGLGYATPFLRPFADEAERAIALMPAEQGVLPWVNFGLLSALPAHTSCGAAHGQIGSAVG